jgi:2-polyprenyl-3-methyl-5-hydroxy-6-metoxy-1,4-benzoquinol methylase
MWKWTLAQAAEIRWWKNYLKNKSPEQYLLWKKNYWITFLTQFDIKLEKDMVCLDAGSSLAGIFTVLNEQKVTAIDPLLNQYKQHLSMFFNTTNYHNVIFKNMSLEELSDTEIYDNIFCLNVINHVKDIHLSIQKLWNGLKIGGKLYLSVDAHNYRFLKYIFKLIPADILHPHQLDTNDYIRLLSTICDKIIAKPTLIKKEKIFSYWLFILQK